MRAFGEPPSTADEREERMKSLKTRGGLAVASLLALAALAEVSLQSRSASAAPAVQDVKLEDIKGGVSFVGDWVIIHSADKFERHYSFRASATSKAPTSEAYVTCADGDFQVIIARQHQGAAVGPYLPVLIKIDDNDPIELRGTQDHVLKQYAVTVLDANKIERQLIDGHVMAVRLKGMHGDEDLSFSFAALGAARDAVLTVCRPPKSKPV